MQCQPDVRIWRIVSIARARIRDATGEIGLAVVVNWFGVESFKQQGATDHKNQSSNNTSSIPCQEALD
eukprot:scaffold18738_cov57-Attheya_sp.AAC.2